MLDQFDNESLRAACVAMRAAIARRARGDVVTMYAPLRALADLEQAAINAPQNRGWLRKRQIELREALNRWTPDSRVRPGIDELQILYRDIVAVLQIESRPSPAMSHSPWLLRSRY